MIMSWFLNLQETFAAWTCNSASPSVFRCQNMGERNRWLRFSGLASKKVLGLDSKKLGKKVGGTWGVKDSGEQKTWHCKFQNAVHSLGHLGKLFLKMNRPPIVFDLKTFERIWGHFGVLTKASRSNPPQFTSGVSSDPEPLWFKKFPGHETH